MLCMLFFISILIIGHCLTTEVVFKKKSPVICMAVKVNVKKNHIKNQLTTTKSLFIVYYWIFFAFFIILFKIKPKNKKYFFCFLFLRKLVYDNSFKHLISRCVCIPPSVLFLINIFLSFFRSLF